MTLLDEQTKNDVKDILAEVAGPAKLLVFTQDFECQFCAETRSIAEEIAALSDNVSLEVKDFVADKETAEAYRIDKIPAIAVLGAGDTDYGIRYYGIPSGYEFSSLLESIKMVGNQAHPLSDATLEFLDSLEAPLDLQVFVTPTCPYCPGAVVLAHYMALASDKVSAAMVEASEFPHLSMRYNVMGVPRTVVNEDIGLFIEGAAPEPVFVGRVREMLE